MRVPKNPFILNGYHSPPYFCNRLKEMDWLNDQFKNERNAVLYAHRRMGKSALIKHFFYHLEKEKRAKTLFIDLLGTSNLAEANRKIAEAIVMKFGILKAGIGQRLLNILGSLGATIGLDPLSGTPQISFGILKGTEVERSMESLGSFLKEMSFPIVIAIDEFQQITNYPEQNAEAVFRTWTQEFPMIRFVFSGSHRHMMQTMFSDQNRPFYNSAQLFALQAIDKTEYSHFINSFFKRSSIKLEESVLDTIFNWTRMQTYYVQLACNKLYSRDSVPTKELLIEIQQEMILQEEPLFGTYQELLTDFQWRTLKALALDEKVESPTSQEFLGKHNLGAPSSVSTALQMLIKKGFIVKENTYYQVHDTLLMRWLQQI